MTIQEKIREGVITNIVKVCSNLSGKEIIALADKILKDEDSQGAVVLVERELPNMPYRDYIRIGLKDSEMGKVVKRDLDKAGWKAVEPIISELSKRDNRLRGKGI